MFDWKKTAEKVGIQIAIVFIAGVAATYGQNPYYLALAPAITGIVNWLKHKNDS